MTDPDDRQVEQELQEAALDSAAERAEEHARERGAAHRQGLIEKETREHGLDEG